MLFILFMLLIIFSSVGVIGGIVFSDKQEAVLEIQKIEIDNADFLKNAFTSIEFTSDKICKIKSVDSKGVILDEDCIVEFKYNYSGIIVSQNFMHVKSTDTIQDIRKNVEAYVEELIIRDLPKAEASYISLNLKGTKIWGNKKDDKRKKPKKTKT